MKNDVRPAAVSGQFYPADPEELQTGIKNYLQAARPAAIKNIRALIAPHAGYIYSGPVAAYGYRELAGRDIRRVILIGNSHRDYFPGWAVDDHAAWQTPLGEIKVDIDGAKKIINANPAKIYFNREPHRAEHALEVQLPFLQTVLKNNFKIIPILFGNSGENGYKILATALEQNLEEGDLIVASSDMSHYLSCQEATAIDKTTIKEILAKKIPRGENVLCGIEAVKTLEQIALDLNWKIELLKYANSGDTAGDKTAVVGYGSVIFSGGLKTASAKESDNEADSSLNKKQRQTLKEIAKISVETYIKNHKKADFPISDSRLEKTEGAFVTLTSQRRLRGCIGNIIGFQPLWQTVRDMAIAAATQDNRFLPVQESEFPDLNYEISVLSQPQLIHNWRDIKLGEEGVIAKKGGRTGVFLPQVAEETGWNLEEFLGHLCSDKAGLPVDCYKNDPGVELYVFTAQVF
jgi:hypothetical protein